MHLRTHGIGGRLTPKELEFIRREYIQGGSTIRIANSLGRSAATINLALRKMGIRLRTQSEAALVRARGWRKLSKIRPEFAIRHLTIPPELLIEAGIDPSKTLLGKWVAGKKRLILRIKEL